MIIITDCTKKATHNDDSTKRSLRENQFLFSHVKQKNSYHFIENL